MTDEAKIVSLQTLAQAELVEALPSVEKAHGYIERLYDTVDDSGEQYGETRALAVAARNAVAALQQIESALAEAVKLGGHLDFID